MMMPAVEPITGIFENASAIGASEAASSPRGIRPAAMVERPAYRRMTIAVDHYLWHGLVGIFYFACHIASAYCAIVRPCGCRYAGEQGGNSYRSACSSGHRNQLSVHVEQANANQQEEGQQLQTGNKSLKPCAGFYGAIMQRGETNNQQDCYDFNADSCQCRNEESKIAGDCQGHDRAG